AFGIQQGKDLSELSLEEMQGFDQRIEADVFEVLTLEGSVNARNVVGGTAPAQVYLQVAAGRKLIAD
ncbi:MAG: argininosuccinate lyase, partial [Gammaproteobacteria bacterium]|nr:argininosuccinate lyase [Gammaproteobacteria bacterium]